MLASMSGSPSGSNGGKPVPIPKRRVAPRECLGDAGANGGGAAPILPLTAGRKSGNSSKLVAGRHCCLVCTEVLPEQWIGTFVRKAFGQLWLCSACVTEDDLSPLRTQRQASDKWVFARNGRHTVRGMARSSSAPGPNLKTKGRGPGVGCELCQKRISSSDGSASGLDHVFAGLCWDGSAECDFESKLLQPLQRKSTPRVLLDELLLPECIVDSEPPELVI